VITKPAQLLCFILLVLRCSEFPWADGMYGEACRRTR